MCQKKNWSNRNDKLIVNNQESFFDTLLKTTDKVSASGSVNGAPIPGISINGKVTGYIKGIKFEFLR